MWIFYWSLHILLNYGTEAVMANGFATCAFFKKCTLGIALQILSYNNTSIGYFHGLVNKGTVKKL